MVAPPKWILIARAVESRLQSARKDELSTSYRSIAQQFAVAPATVKRARNAYLHLRRVLGDTLDAMTITGGMTAVEEWRTLANYDADLAVNLVRRVLAGTVTVAELRRRNEGFRDIKALEASPLGRIEHGDDLRVDLRAARALAITRKHDLLVEGEPIQNALTRFIGCDAATVDADGQFDTAVFWSPTLCGALNAARSIDDVLRFALAAERVFRHVVVLLGTLEEERRWRRFQPCCLGSSTMETILAKDAASVNVGSRETDGNCEPT